MRARYLNIALICPQDLSSTGVSSVGELLCSVRTPDSSVA